MRARRPAGPESYAGSILLAHPELADPNFRRTVVLMTTHGTDGAMGVVLNRPLHKRLGELGGDFALGPLTGVPLFHGGPVQTEQLIIAAWRSHPAGFQLHLGIDPEKAIQFIGDDGMHIRAFFGHSGWSAGQLENELKQHTWIVAPPPPDLFTQPGDAALWRRVLAGQGTEWRLLAEEPDEAGEN
jgi:putative transcriptional regulator